MSNKRYYVLGGLLLASLGVLAVFVGSLLLPVFQKALADYQEFQDSEFYVVDVPLSETKTFTIECPETGKPLSYTLRIINVTDVSFLNTRVAYVLGDGVNTGAVTLVNNLMDHPKITVDGCDGKPQNLIKFWEAITTRQYTGLRILVHKKLVLQ